MALTERRIRQIIREEASKAISTRRLREGFGDHEDDDEGVFDAPHRRTGEGWLFLGSQGDELGLASGDEKLDGMWREWMRMTEMLRHTYGDEVFPLDDDPREKLSVLKAMQEVLGDY